VLGAWDSGLAAERKLSADLADWRRCISWRSPADNSSCCLFKTMLHPRPPVQIVSVVISVGLNLDPTANNYWLIATRSHTKAVWAPTPACCRAALPYVSLSRPTFRSASGPHSDSPWRAGEPNGRATRSLVWFPLGHRPRIGLGQVASVLRKSVTQGTSRRPLAAASILRRPINCQYRSLPATIVADGSSRLPDELPIQRGPA
jgi:hypothetical protein